MDMSGGGPRGGPVLGYGGAASRPSPLRWSQSSASGIASVTVSPERTRAFDRYIVPELETLYRVALAITGDQPEAEDLVQDTLIRAFRALDRFDGAYPRAWLLTILRNTNISRHRRRRPGLLADADRIDEWAEPVSSASNPESVAMAAVFDETVEAAFGSLGADQQVVIRLIDVDGLSYQEAAEVLGVPIGTVMSRLHRGRTKIKRKLAGSGRRVGRL